MVRKTCDKQYLITQDSTQQLERNGFRQRYRWLHRNIQSLYVSTPVCHSTDSQLIVYTNSAYCTLYSVLSLVCRVHQAESIYIKKMDFQNLHIKVCSANYSKCLNKQLEVKGPILCGFVYESAYFTCISHLHQNNLIVLIISLAHPEGGGRHS